MNAVFEVRNASAGYGSAPVLHDITLDIREGEFVAVIGPNGAGKSTLVRLLSGELDADTGSVSFFGREIRSMNRTALARSRSVVRQIFENMQPFQVREFVAMGLFPHKRLFEAESRDDRECVARIVELTGIGHILERRLGELSGGEMQLVFIAHALVQNSRVVLLDEPVSHLDMKHALRVMDLLHRLHKDGATLVAVLHDVNIAADYCSAVMGIKNGRKVFHDVPDKVLRYDVLEDLFEARCVTLTNPISGRPFAYPVPGHVMEKKQT